MKRMCRLSSGRSFLLFLTVLSDNSTYALIYIFLNKKQHVVSDLGGSSFFSVVFYFGSSLSSFILVVPSSSPSSPSGAPSSHCLGSSSCSTVSSDTISAQN
jgi:hypothetical protein